MKVDKLLIISVIVTFILRMLYIVLCSDEEFLSKGDNLQYLTFADQILNQGFFVTNINVKTEIAGNWGILGPGYPLLISVFLIGFGHNYFPIFVLNALLTSLVPIILFFLTKEILKKTSLSFAILIWGIFYINYFKYTPYLLKESLVYFLLPLTILLLIKELKSKIIITWNLGFSVICYIYLIHTDERYFFYFPFLIILFFFFYKINLKLFLRKQLLFGFGVILLMTPWLIRNYLTYGQIVILTERTTKVTSLFWGKDLTINYKNKASQAFINRNLKDSTVNEYYINLSKEIQNKTTKSKGPYKFNSLEKYLKATIHYWKPTYFKTSFINDGFRKQKWSISHNLASIIFYGVFLPFYFLGTIYLLVKRNNIIALFIAILPIIQMIIHVALVHVLERYRNPVDCFVVIIALYFLSKFLYLLPNRRNPVESSYISNENDHLKINL